MMTGKCKCGCGKSLYLKDSRGRARNYLHGHNKWNLHGMTSTTEHNTWLEMRRRCNKENRHNYKYYGGKGIKVCERWNNFENFIKDMGKKPSKMHTIDRIDNSKGYEPSNCRWATRKEQANNRGVYAV